MPYINEKERLQYKDVLDKLPDIKSKGDLEYCIFYIMKRIYMKNREWRYSHLHDCTYAAAHCADEFRRRYLDKREDEAIINNGDI